MSSAHRDPAVFENPDTFDVGRNPNPHLGFSKGTHFCLGAPLARMEARVVLEHLLDSTASFELLTEQPRPATSPIVRGYSKLPVRLTPRV
jgi:cytochrome P450